MSENLMTLIVFILFITICIGINTIISYAHCKGTGEVLSYQVEWHYWSGCVVTRPDGNKVLLRQIRDMDR